MQLGYTALRLAGLSAGSRRRSTLVTLMTILGLGFLTPVNVWVCLELQKPAPDLKRISSWMQRYFYAVAAQGTDADRDHRGDDAVPRRRLTGLDRPTAT